MGRITVLVYKPKPGQEERLLALIRNHLPLLREQDLVTDRAPIVMQASNGFIIEIFEWKSSEAIAAAHENSSVQRLWSEFSEVCDYGNANNIPEFQNMFSEFEAITLS